MALNKINTETKDVKEALIKIIESIPNHQEISFDITYGIRDSTPTDDNYLHGIDAMVHDGSFTLTISGNSCK